MSFDGNGWTPESVQTDDDRVVIFVPGIPVPQGSKTAFVVGGRAVVTDQNRKTLKPWRAVIAEHADIARTFDCPVAVRLVFYMPRPKRPRWTRPAVKPDIDKLTRAVLDGITDGGLIADDARVVDLHVHEEYATGLTQFGVYIYVSEAR